MKKHLRFMGLALLVAGIAGAVPARSGSLIAAAFSPDGKVLVSAGLHSPLRLWDVAEGRELRQLAPKTSWMGSVAFSLDGKQVAAADEDGVIHLYDAAGVLPPRKIGGPSKADPLLHQALRFAPGGKLLISGDAQGVALWELEGAKELRRLDIPAGAPCSMALHPDGNRIVLSGRDSPARIWDLTAGKELFALSHPGGASGVAWSPDGKILATVGWDRCLRVWEADTGVLSRTLDLKGASILCVAFHPGGKLLASGDLGGVVSLLDARTWKEVRTLTGHHGVSSVAFSPDGTQLATGGMHEGDQIVRLWDVATGRQIHQLRVR